VVFFDKVRPVGIPTGFGPGGLGGLGEGLIGFPVAVGETSRKAVPSTIPV